MACRAALWRVNAGSVNRTDRHMIQGKGHAFGMAKTVISVQAARQAKAPGAVHKSGKKRAIRPT